MILCAIGIGKSLNRSVLGRDIAIEASLLARKYARNQRNFAFMGGLPSIRTWTGVWTRARSRNARPCHRQFSPPPRRGAVDAARANAERAGVGDHLDIRCSILLSRRPASRGWLFTNPVRVRLGERIDARSLCDPGRVLVTA